MKLHRVEQGSVEWYRLRLGRPTSSNFHKIVTPKGEPSKQAPKYLYRLVAERLLNETMDDEIGFVKWVAQGKEQEPYAVKQFEFVNDVRTGTRRLRHDQRRADRGLAGSDFQGSQGKP